MIEGDIQDRELAWKRSCPPWKRRRDGADTRAPVD